MATGSRIKEVGVRPGPLLGALLWSVGLLITPPPSPVAVCLLIAPQAISTVCDEMGQEGTTPQQPPPPRTVGLEEPEYLQQPHDHSDPKGSDLRRVTTVHHNDHKRRDNQHCNSQMTIQLPRRW